jgi:chaperonin GroEL
MVRGARVLSRAVAATLGPGGRVVLIDDRFGRVIATKDGVTVARAITLANNEENMGAKLLADAALKVADEAGDGTTTCVVIAAELLDRCNQLVLAGMDPAAVAQQVRAEAKDIEAAIWGNSTPIDGDPGWIALVASVSCKADSRVIQAVVAAYSHVGVEGSVLLQEGSSDHVEVDLQEGFRIDKGWHSGAMAPHTGLTHTLEDVLVLVAHRPITDAGELLPVMEFAASCKSGLLIVCEQILGSAQQLVTQNAQNAALKVLVVHPPGFDDRQWAFMDDLAAWCGATMHDMSTGPLNPRNLGLVGKVQQDRRKTVLLTPLVPDKARIDKHIAGLVKRMKDEPNAYDRDKFAERLGRLRGKVASISVGCPTPAEAREVKDRTEDAIHAVRVAYRDGVQPGAGVALLRASLAHGDSPGAVALAAAVREPARIILRNAGREPSEALQAVNSDSRWQIGAAADGVKCSLLSFPDPTAVVIGALNAAVSTVTTLLLAETSISMADVEDPQ